MTVSVVIPVWNGKKFLEKNLPAVAKIHADEVIIVDDASPDDSVSYIESNFPNFRIIRHRQNTRFPKAVNDGVRQVNTDIVILLNQDVSPHPELLKYVLPHFRDPRIFAVTFNEQHNSWANATIKNGFVEFNNGPIDNQVHSSFWANGGSAAFRVSLWRKLGGFDTVFSPGYFEDFDLSWQARRLGYEIIWEPRALVTHTSESTNNVAFTPLYLRRIKERNYLIAQWKNLSFKDLLIHKIELLKRILTHPGYLIPVLMSAYHLPHIVYFRFKNHD